MMKKQLKGITEKTAIHCPTEQEAIAVCKLFHEAGLKWKVGGSFIEIHRWDYYEKTTCYVPEKGQFGDLELYKKEGYSILPASQFLAMNQEPELQWVFKTDEELKNLVAEFMGTKLDNFDQFLASKRKPLFSLITKDNVTITDPEQDVWFIDGGKAKSTKAKSILCPCFSTKESATAHLRHNFRVICLNDLADYIDSAEKWELLNQLVNERINGK